MAAKVLTPLVAGGIDNSIAAVGHAAQMQVVVLIGRIAVQDTNGKALPSCSPARAAKYLKLGWAVVHLTTPVTLRLINWVSKPAREPAPVSNVTPLAEVITVPQKTAAPVPKKITPTHAPKAPTGVKSPPSKRALVQDYQGRALDSCTFKRAAQLIGRGWAHVHRTVPYTIRFAEDYKSIAYEKKSTSAPASVANPAAKKQAMIAPTKVALQDADGNVLKPCTPTHAARLIDNGWARVHLAQPLTLRFVEKRKALVAAVPDVVPTVTAVNAAVQPLPAPPVKEVLPVPLVVPQDAVIPTEIPSADPVPAKADTPVVNQKQKQKTSKAPVQEEFIVCDAGWGTCSQEDARAWFGDNATRSHKSALTVVFAKAVFRSHVWVCPVDVVAFSLDCAFERYERVAIDLGVMLRAHLLRLGASAGRRVANDNQDAVAGAMKAYRKIVAVPRVQVQAAHDAKLVDATRLVLMPELASEAILLRRPSADDALDFTLDAAYDGAYALASDEDPDNALEGWGDTELSVSLEGQPDRFTGAYLGAQWDGRVYYRDQWLTSGEPLENSTSKRREALGEGEADEVCAALQYIQLDSMHEFSSTFSSYRATSRAITTAEATAKESEAGSPTEPSLPSPSSYGLPGCHRIDKFFTDMHPLPLPDRATDTDPDCAPIRFQDIQYTGICPKA